jgi:hypothetical protein
MKPSEIIQALAADLVQYPFGAIRLEERTTRVQAFIVNWMLDHNVSIKDDQSPKDKIIIEVSGGVVQSIDDIPQDVVVEVHDYDVEGEDETELETDAHGDNYRCGVWEN